MNVKLQYDAEFLAGIYYDSRLQMNQYSVSLNLVTCVNDPITTNIAMDRVKAFLYGQLESTVFINTRAGSETAEMLAILGCNVTTLPEEPVDQIIGMMLYYKLNAVMEGRMIIDRLDISSVLGDSVWYQHDNEDGAGPFAADGWWNEANCQHHNLDTADESENVVKVINKGWREYGLEWPDENRATANTVVFANFPRNEN